MKKNIKTFALSLIVLFTVNSAANAQTLIHYWNFNSYVGGDYTPNIPGVDADYSDLDTAYAKIVYTEMSGVSASFSTYMDSAILSSGAPDYDTVNAQLGAPSGSALRVRNPSDSMYLLFYIPTTHFENITIAYGTESSSATHGMGQQFFSYSTDSGATWITTGGLSVSSYSVMTTVARNTVSFTDVNANNNPKLVFRILFGANDTGTKGNDRFDNVTVTGDTISTNAVSQIAVIPANYSLYPNPVINTLDINSDINDAKSIKIYNTLGQTIYTTTKQGKNCSLDVSSLQPGDYFIDIKENTNGNTTSMRFVKQ